MNRTTRTCVSGSSEPMLVAPCFTTSVSCVMVLAEDWAAWASLSWLDAAPDTSSLVSSTRAFAVFNMFSLKRGSNKCLALWFLEMSIITQETNSQTWAWHCCEDSFLMLFLKESVKVGFKLWCIQISNFNLSIKFMQRAHWDVWFDVDTWKCSWLHK